VGIVYFVSQKKNNTNNNFYLDAHSRRGASTAYFLLVLRPIVTSRLDCINVLVMNVFDLYLFLYYIRYSVRDECYYTESELVDGKAPTGSEVRE